MTKWAVLGVLAAAQFLMVLDQAVMNVAISQLVEDLDTTVQQTQSGHARRAGDDAPVGALPLRAGHGRPDADRRQARRHLRPPPRLRDRPRHLPGRLRADGCPLERPRADVCAVYSQS